MRYFMVVGLVCFIFFSACQTLSVKPEPAKDRLGFMPSGQPFKPFPVITDRQPRQSHYVASGYMGDSDLSLSGAYVKTPSANGPCLRVNYRASGVKGWSGIYWQDPADNWGDRPGRTGYDLRGATKLTFWARGQKGGEKVREFKVGGLFGQYPDSDVASIIDIRLTQDWRKYAIDLTGKDLRHIIGGFCFVVIKAENPGGATFYLNDVFYEGLEPPSAHSEGAETVSAKVAEPVLAPPVVPSTVSVSSPLPESIPVPAVPVLSTTTTTKDLKIKETRKGLRVSFSSQFLFAPGQAELASGSSRILEQLSALLSAYPSNRVLIEGHSDNTGASSLNLKLSQLRAEAVRDYLIKKGGYEASRFRVMGYGATRPVADNDTKVGRALNRRVEVTILKSVNE
ncbi:MAG: OmpA family protein [Elusimicrobiota bacterium]|jgi:outer membrane protein OmpA-like peptidoglycan-associated protein